MMAFIDDWLNRVDESVSPNTVYKENFTHHSHGCTRKSESISLLGNSILWALKFSS